MFRKITEAQLAACQFDASLTDQYGAIRKPADWEVAGTVGDTEVDASP